MLPLPFVWPYACIFWLVYLWSWWPEFKIIRRAQCSVGCSDARSLQVLVWGHGTASVVAFILAWVPAFQISSHRVELFLLGVGVLICGSLLRRHCWRILGASFTGDVRASAGQQVITRGAYAFVRHPSYTAGILVNTGIGIALGSWASIGVLFVATVAAYLYRISIEERELLATLGDPYEQFMATRKRLFPFIY